MIELLAGRERGLGAEAGRGEGRGEAGFAHRFNRGQPAG